MDMPLVIDISQNKKLFYVSFKLLPFTVHPPLASITIEQGLIDEYPIPINDKY